MMNSAVTKSTLFSECYFLLESASSLFLASEKPVMSVSLPALSILCHMNSNYVLRIGQELHGKPISRAVVW